MLGIGIACVLELAAIAVALWQLIKAEREVLKAVQETRDLKARVEVLEEALR